MSRRIALLLEEQPAARAVLLEKHGLVTWGETGHESYEATIEFVARAARAIEAAARGRFGLGGRKAAERDEGSGDLLLSQSLPALRGALLADADGLVLEVDRSPDAVAFASSVRAPEVSQIGAPVPRPSDQHQAQAALRRRSTRRRAAPAISPRRSGAASTSTPTGTAATTSATSTTRRGSSRSIRPGPRVVLVPGVGIVTTGSDAARARVSRDLYHRAIAVAGRRRRARRLPVAERERGVRDRVLAARALQARAGAAAAASSPAASRVITGGASGIGRATARLLAERGAHVVVADLNAEGAKEVADELVATYGLRRSIAVATDVTDEAAVAQMVRETVLEYGGLDILVASAGLATSAPVTETTVEEWERNFAVLARGYFLAAREAFRVLVEQGRGGSLVFVGSKNALVAGANAAAYSSAKAASLHLARCLAEEGGPHGIRVNTVNPDAVIQGSEHLVVRLEGRAGEHVRRDRGRPPGLLPRPDEARGQRLPRGRRRGDRVLRRAALRQVHRKRRQRRRRRHRRVSPVVRWRRTTGPVRHPVGPLTRKEPSMHKRRWAIVVVAAILVAGVAVVGRAGRAEPFDGRQDVLLHPEGHAQPVRGDRRPRRQARPHRARQQAGRLLGHRGHGGGAAAGNPGGDPVARSRHRHRRQRPAGRLPGAQAGPGAGDEGRRLRLGRRTAASCSSTRRTPRRSAAARSSCSAS